MIAVISPITPFDIFRWRFSSSFHFRQLSLIAFILFSSLSFFAFIFAVRLFSSLSRYYWYVSFIFFAPLMISFHCRFSLLIAEAFFADFQLPTGFQAISHTAAAFIADSFRRLSPPAFSCRQPPAFIDEGQPPLRAIGQIFSWHYWCWYAAFDIFITFIFIFINI